MRRISTIPLLIAVLFHLNSTAFAEETSVRTYKLPRHGALRLSVPTSWKDTVIQPPFDLPPTITMRPATGDAFILMITPVWNLDGAPDLNSDEKIRELIDREKQAMSQTAAEKEPELRSIKGPEAYGYYYAATIKASELGEWNHVLRADVGTGELLVRAALGSHEKEPGTVSRTIAMFRNARQIKEDPNADYRYPPKLPREQECGLPTHEQKMWALATHAIITENNRERHELLGGCERTPEEVIKQRNSLVEWWDVRSREDLIETLKWIEEGGHRKDLDDMRRFVASLPNEERAAFLKQAGTNPEMANKISVMSLYRPIYGDKSIVAWDFARYTALCGWGYVAGHFTEEEAWQRMMPAARVLQQTFDSWEDMGRNYMIGREFWSLQHTQRTGDSMQRAFKRLRTDTQSPWKTIPWNLDLSPKNTDEARR